MKKFVLAAALAVLAAGGLTPRASAWCKICFSCGYHLCCEKSPCCWTFSCTKTCCDDGGCDGGGPGGGMIYGYPSDWYPKAYAAPAAAPANGDKDKKTFPPDPKPDETKPPTGNRPVSYTNGAYRYVPPSPSTGYMIYPQGGYGASAVPSYWYGR